MDKAVKPASPANVREDVDTQHGFKRTEVICNVCNVHLGHVVLDGAPPTGLRYRINSASFRVRLEVACDDLRYV